MKASLELNMQSCEDGGKYLGYNVKQISAVTQKSGDLKKLNKK